ncbi:uncharacterized protein PGTG_02022 [Puccinia graminis f. sp. tritici CRL 75-36-700-3]|uniref:Uncharacterized protein n=1 Tax=Puccinia graminis f. sp. tritici (strain CRL 75-36-700-3 / race SCCL) TaxID=418459 RepID=E3JWY6_PUCGT|nr:uncharacterized protein PGTG_02022 [Puccinia graminis f. sp. tritici CRL 75-36-700-3]EFP76561.1 hypothetical protein PGTG_02022 [Puccinia graminis f. sp. tritici CRL 75-36-700-3]
MKEEIDPEIQLNESEEEVIKITRKLKEFLLKGLETGHLKDSTQKFFWDVREDLLKLRRRIIDPKDFRIEDYTIRGIDPSLFHIFDFLESRMNVRDNEVLKRAAEEERRKFYWKRLRLNLIAYGITRIHFQKDKAWNQKIRGNQAYRELIDMLDAEVKNFKNIPKLINQKFYKRESEVHGKVKELSGRIPFGSEIPQLKFMKFVHQQTNLVQDQWQQRFGWNVNCPNHMDWSSFSLWKN